MNVPESMEPGYLRSIADWLDCYEATIERFIAGCSQYPRLYDELLVDAETCPGNEMQNDLRWWADELEGKGDGDSG